MNKKIVVLMTTVGFVVLLDVVTKAYIASTMFLHESFTVIEGFFNITYIRNPGAAFGFLAGASPGIRITFFLFVTIAVMVMILYYIIKSDMVDLLETFSLSLILSGALGNMIDRVRFGEVIDFIDVYIESHHWPAFNVADSAISVGAVMIVLAMLKKKEQGDHSPSGKIKEG
ncbi:MAG: signal peptidase II [Deltaproteobacteria bacterium]|nr:signal peptidase II [Deltaproteobacteria bacterium]